jgi:hypothetical protein
MENVSLTHVAGKTRRRSTRSTSLAARITNLRTTHLRMPVRLLVWVVCMRVAAMVVVAMAAAATDTRRRSITATAEAIVGERAALLAAIPTELDEIGQSFAADMIFLFHGSMDIPVRLP